MQRIGDLVRNPEHVVQRHRAVAGNPGTQRLAIDERQDVEEQSRRVSRIEERQDVRFLLRKIQLPQQRHKARLAARRVMHRIVAKPSELL